MKKSATPARKRAPSVSRVKQLEDELAHITSLLKRAETMKNIEHERQIQQLQELVAYRDRQLDAAGTALANQSADRVSGGIAQQNAAWTRQREEMARTIRNLERECAEYKAKLMLAEDKLKVQVSPRESLRAFLRGILDEE